MAKKKTSPKTGLYRKYKNIYYLYLIVNGKQTTRSTGETNMHDAMEWVKEHYPNLIATDNKITIKDFFVIYRKYIESNFAEKTKKMYNKAISLFTEINHKVYLKEINSQDLEDYRNTLLKKYSKTSVDMYLRGLKSSLSYAFNKNNISTNPGSKVKSFPQPEKEKLCFSDEQVKQILELCPPELRSIVKFALLTGMRLGEIKNCKWSDIKDGILTIGVTKTKKIRKLYISKALWEVLNGLPKNSEYLFHYKYAGSMSKEFKKVLIKAFDKETADKFHFHCLRHTFITNMLLKDVPIVKVGQIAGHSDIKTTMRYAHISSIDKEAMECVKV